MPQIMSTSDTYVGAWIKAEDTIVSSPNVISKLGTDGGRTHSFYEWLVVGFAFSCFYYV